MGEKVGLWTEVVMRQAMWQTLCYCQLVTDFQHDTGPSQASTAP